MQLISERSALLGFSATGMVAIFLILLADRLGWPSFMEIMLHSATAAWIQAIGSIGAIGAAGWVVHRQHLLEIQRQEEQKVQSQVDVINGAMLTLFSQMNMLLSFRKQILEPERNAPARHLTLAPTEIFDFSHWIVDWKTLSFLVSSTAQAALLDAVLAHNAFHSAIQSANDRSRFHLNEFQPKMEKSGFNFDAGVDLASVEQEAGSRLNHSLRTMTDSLYQQVDLAISHLSKAGGDAAKALRDVYVGHRILGFSPPLDGTKSR